MSSLCSSWSSLCCTYKRSHTRTIYCSVLITEAGWDISSKMDTIPQKKSNATQTFMLARNRRGTHHFLLMWPVERAQDDLWDDTSIWRSHPLFNCQQMVVCFLAVFLGILLNPFFPPPFKCSRCRGLQYIIKAWWIHPRYPTVGKGFLELEPVDQELYWILVGLQDLFPKCIRLV